MTQRKYQMIKLSAGDWLLPGNDGESLYRLQRYEDGPSYGLEDWPKDITFWRVLRWAGEFRNIDPDDFDKWTEVDNYLTSRSQAIDKALEDFA